MEQVEQFDRDGFLIVRSFATSEEVQTICAVAERALAPVVGPVEYEADVHYPGSPESREAPGGRTPRRLLHAVARSEDIRAWATQPRLGRMLRQLLRADEVLLCQNHHNCIMTKFPQYSSATLWHQDVRYWSFDRPDLISFWLALGQEEESNGALFLLPGSHRLTYQPHQLDAMKFLRTDVDDNQALLAAKTGVTLAPGDLMFFHCRTFHAARANRTKQVKLSLALTAHAADNHPTPGTRSANLPSLPFRTDDA